MGRTLALAPGAYSLTGVDMTPRATRRMPIDVGIYMLVGEQAALLCGRQVVLASGSFTLNGTALTRLSQGFAISCEAGAYATAGTAVTLRAIRRLDMAAGSYLSAGKPAAFGYQRALPGARFVVPGSAPRLSVVDPMSRRVAVELILRRVTVAPADSRYVSVRSLDRVE